MKLLLDQNLSPRLCGALRDLWTEISHVRDVGLQAAEDLVVWEYAAKHGLAIVSKDSDFNNLSFLFGAPPKVQYGGDVTTRCTLSDARKSRERESPQ